MSSPFEIAIYELLEALPPGKSLCPTDVAKHVDPENWRHRLGQVRAEAVGLARLERLVITRHNKPVAKLVPIGRERLAGSLRRQAALDALQAFEPIAVSGATLADLIAAGRT